MINETDIEVRYQETDQMGIVYHANYLVWFEIGRTKLIEDLGFQYAAMETDGYVSPVVDIQINYKQPAIYGQKVTVETRVEAYTGIRTVYGYQVKNEKGDLLCTGTSTHVVVKKGSFRPVALRKVNPAWDQEYRRIVGAE